MDISIMLLRDDKKTYTHTPQLIVVFQLIFKSGNLLENDDKTNDQPTRNKTH